MTSAKDTAKVGRMLRSYATHHDHGEGWTYTRDIGDLKYIRLARDYQGWDAIHRRIARAFNPKSLFGTRPMMKWLGMKPTLWSVWAHIVVNLRTEKNIPDGRINGNFVFWEEDGEYIELVGPTIGEKIADFLEHEPDNPHAQAIAKEIRRIRELSYSKQKASTA